MKHFFLIAFVFVCALPVAQADDGFISAENIFDIEAPFSRPTFNGVERSFPWALDQTHEDRQSLYTNYERLALEYVRYSQGDVEDFFLASEAMTEVSQLARDFFESHGIDTDERCGALISMMSKWRSHGISPMLLINTWLLTKVAIADNLVREWIETQDTFSNAAIREANLPKILTHKRIQHLIRIHKIMPLVNQILQTKWKLAWLENEGMHDLLLESNGLYERLEHMVSAQEPWMIRIEEVREKKEALFQRAKRKKEKILEDIIAQGMDPDNFIEKIIKIFPRTLETLVNLTVGNIAYYGGGYLGLITGHGWEWSEAGVEVIEFNRHFMNDHLGGSVLGSDEYFRTSSNWENFFSMNPLAQSIGAATQAILDEVDGFKETYDKWMLGMTGPI